MSIPNRRASAASSIAQNGVNNMLRNARINSRRGPMSLRNIGTSSTPSLPPLISEPLQGQYCNMDPLEFTRSSGHDPSLLPTVQRRIAGPPPPPSWIPIVSPALGSRPRTAGLSKSHTLLNDVVYTPDWRIGALSFVMTSFQDTFMTLQACVLRAMFLPARRDSLPLDGISCMPPHLRQQIARYAALYSPLDELELRHVWAEEGCAGGEIIVVGKGKSDRGIPNQSVRPLLYDMLHSQDDEAGHEEVEDWDQPDGGLESQKPPTSVHLLTLSLRLSLITSLPPTVTHLSLIRVSATLDNHTSVLPKVSRVLPLLVYLDVSFNDWMGIHELEGVKWGVRWQSLQTLVMRGPSFGLDSEREAAFNCINGPRPGKWIEQVFE